MSDDPIEPDRDDEEATASPEDFEQDPARNPDDDELQDIKGG